MKNKSVLWLSVLITLVFAVTLVLCVKSGSRKMVVARSIMCDITAHIDKPEGITIIDNDEVEFVIPDKTEIHITLIHRDGSVEVDRVDVELSDEVKEYYSGSEYFMYKRRIKVEDTDSEEAKEIFNKMQKRYDNYETNTAVVAVIAALIYLCPVVVYAVSKIKKDRYGIGLAVVPMLCLLVSLTAFELLFRAFV